jgi:hypothetical protein
LIYYIYHWYGGSLSDKGVQTFKHPFTAISDKGEYQRILDAVELPDTLEALQDFIKQFGPVILKPPTEDFPYWSIYVTDESKRFGQR